MKFKLLVPIFAFLLISGNLFAQKPIAPSIEKLQFHLSSYQDLDASIKKLLAAGYKKINWQKDPQQEWLKNAAYAIVGPDSIERVIEIIYGENKQVFQACMYFGLVEKKWNTLSNSEKANIAVNMFDRIRNDINQEYGTKKTGNRWLGKGYKEADYDSPDIFLKGLNEKNLYFFATWGPFPFYPIELENYNARLIKITVADAKARQEYYKATKK